MNEATIEGTLTTFLHAYERMCDGDESAKPLAKMAIQRMQDYGLREGVGQHWVLIMEEDFDYAKSVHHRVKS